MVACMHIQRASHTEGPTMNLLPSGVRMMTGCAQARQLTCQLPSQRNPDVHVHGQELNYRRLADKCAQMIATGSLECGTKLGEGSFGSVHLLKQMPNLVLKLSEIDSTSFSSATSEREVRIMQLCTDYMLKCETTPLFPIVYASGKVGKDQAIIMEKLSGDGDDWMEIGPAVEEVCGMFAQATIGLTVAFPNFGCHSQ